MRRLHCFFGCVAVPAAALFAQPTLSVSPASGGLGTVIEVDLAPQDHGYQMSDVFTTATWIGVYQPTVGAPSAQFTVDYSDAEVIVESPWKAKIILGTGTVTNGPDLLSLGGPGSLVGTFQVDMPYCRADVTHPVPLGDPLYGIPDGIVTGVDLNFYVNLWVANDMAADWTSLVPLGDPLYGVPDGTVTGTDLNYFVITWVGGVCPPSPIAVSGPASVSLTSGESEWRAVSYPGGFFGLDPPEIGDVLQQLHVFKVSTLPDPASLSEAILLGASGAHATSIVLVEENAITSASAPPINVDLVVLNAVGVEIDRVSNVELTPVSNDGDPTMIVYSNDLSKPIVIVDSVLNKPSYPNVIILYAPAGSDCMMVPTP